MPCGWGFRPGLAKLLILGSQSKPQDEPIVHPGDAQTRCPDCGWKITDKFSWCPRCGNRLRPLQCAYCKGILPKDAVNCPRCGAPVDKT